MHGRGPEKNNFNRITKIVVAFAFTWKKNITGTDTKRIKQTAIKRKTSGTGT
jgi:hypothetical protein